jgi:hypothetical protein
MRRVILSVTGAGLLALFLLAPFLLAQPGRICGTVYTRDGETFEGPIRWDKNEAFWDNILDGTKKREGRHEEGRRREKRISIFGLDITWDEKGYESSQASSGIQFGYLKTLERRTRNRAKLELKNGESITFYGSSSDVGSGVREIIIDDPREGEVELDWDDLDMIKFGECDPDLITKPETRLYGEVETRRGDKYTGFVTWDVDELFYSDILDGEQKHRKRKIPFGKIKAIERRSSSSAWVYLRNGDKLKLSGTNDVNSGNRGIVVNDPEFGRVTIEWDDFDRLELLDGGDLLDGEHRGVEIDVEFSQIAEIEKISSRSCRITTRNGNRFKLSGSNDVNDENKGIFVTTEDGDEVELDWYDFDKVVFKRR